MELHDSLIGEKVTKAELLGLEMSWNRDLDSETLRSVIDRLDQQLSRKLGSRAMDDIELVV
jgi:hypothetical protein